MRTPDEIYAAYGIHAGLQMHQLRVAAVGKTVSDALLRDVDTQSVVQACLLHDMGNIIKADFHSFPEFYEPEGTAHWELVKKDFVAKYGNDEHQAAMEMAREIGVSEAVLQLIDGVGFSKLERTRDSDSFEMKIVEYADTRVCPHGVVSQDGRLHESHERYRSVKSLDESEHEDQFEELFANAKQIEQQIFELTAIAPEDITEESVQSLIAELRAAPIF